MRMRARTIRWAMVAMAIAGSSFAQTQPKKTTAPPKGATTQKQFGKSYSTLRPEQKKLVDAYVQRYNETTGSKIVAQQAYDAARISVRTTFDAVTHALLMAKLTDEKGKSLGRAFDQVSAVDEIMGEEADVGGDRQFRLYVYLKPSAFDVLSRSREIVRERDNTVYHKGFPTCFRLKHGPPSIQISMTRDRHMADIDVDYRSSTFPKALFNGHLTASNSDVRAGDNLDRHDNRWNGLTGWWRDVFAPLGGGKSTKDSTARNSAMIPLNPRMKADQGIDQSAHDFLQSWVVSKEPKDSVAYFSRRSYPCMEEIAKRNKRPIPPGMVRVRVRLSMEKFNDGLGAVKSVEEVFEPAEAWSPKLKEEKNAHAEEFRLVSVPPDMGAELECVPIPVDEGGKKHKEKYYATAFRGKRGNAQDKVMVLLWAQEGKYWKVVAIRIQDSNSAGIVPKKASTAPAPTTAPERFAGDPKAVSDITSFYRSWITTRDIAGATKYASEISYACLTPSSGADKKLKPSQRIQASLDNLRQKMPEGKNISDAMTSVDPVNELVRPVEHENSKGFAIMAIPDQMADSFLCQKRKLGVKAPELEPGDAKYGKYYLSASQLDLGQEVSPALLLLWGNEKDHWRVISWSAEVP